MINWVQVHERAIGRAKYESGPYDIVRYKVIIPGS